METLFTLVHISDLHFGDLDPRGLDARTSRLWSLNPALDGLLGHSAKALWHLEEFLDRLRAGGESPRIVVTGDVTAFGGVQQFQDAQDYLARSLRVGARLEVGLGMPDWSDLAIPGNHDHWPGHPWPLGEETAGFGSMFPPTRVPLLDQTFVLGNGAKLRFIGIDSDVDVRAWGAQRFLARGSFRSALDEVSASGALLGGEPDEIRILLLHHSLSWSGHVLGIDADSRMALEQFLAAERFAILLTGHAHVPQVSVHPVAYQGRTFHAWEARCGSTTQRTDVPYGWGARARRARAARMNSLLVHRFLGDSKRLRWEVEAWGLTRRRFELVPVYPASTVLRRALDLALDARPKP